MFVSLPLYIFFAVIMAFLFTVAYAVLHHATPMFFEQKRPEFSARSFRYIAILGGLTLLLYVVYQLLPYPLNNRIQHAVGGGVMASLLFYFVVIDTKIRITRFQYFVMSFLVVTALGVVNELFELAGDYFTSAIFAESIRDTWLDLLSNTVGAVAAGGIFSWLKEK